MNEHHLTEIVDWTIPSGTQIDRENPVIKGVKILGLESRNGRTYTPESVAEAAHLYEGTRVNVNHPRGDPLAPRDYQERIGVLRNVQPRSDGLYADFHLNPKHALAEQFLWDAEHSPESVGFSHNVQARVARRGDRVVVEAITRVISVDLVADPATTRSLFESVQPPEKKPVKTTVKKIVEGLKASHPQRQRLTKLLEQDPFAPMAELPVEAPAEDEPEADPEEQLQAAIEAMVLAVLRDESLSPEEKAAKIESILVAKDEISNGEEPAGGEEPAESTEAVKLRQELARLKAREEARELLTEAKLPQHPAWVKAVAALPASERKAFIETLPRDDHKPPRSTMPLNEHRGATVKDLPKDGKEFARAIKE